MNFVIFPQVDRHHRERKKGLLIGPLSIDTKLFLSLTHFFFRAMEQKKQRVSSWNRYYRVFFRKYDESTEYFFYSTPTLSYTAFDSNYKFRIPHKHILLSCYELCTYNLHVLIHT